MILGIGIDIVEIARIQASIERHGSRFLKKIFTTGEEGYCTDYARPSERFATRFAAKEAAMKALGTGWRDGVGFRSIEVTSDEKGAPALHFSGRVQTRARRLGVRRVFVTLSHSDHYAVAQVILEGEDLPCPPAENEIA
ncbi:MAG: holo-ACP synthase [Planctomycetota bacterium]